MNMLIACDSFKNNLSSSEVGSAIREGFSQVFPKWNYKVFPMSDGGEGVLEILNKHQNFDKIITNTYGPFNKRIDSYYLVKNESAFIELAQTSGLNNLKLDERDIMNASTFGLGEQIRDAINKGFKKIIIFVGGSSSNDAGLGAVQALGADFYSENIIEENISGKHLQSIQKTDLKNFINILDIDFVIATDVNNNFSGNNGAAYIYAAQKGASKSEIEILDKGLKNIETYIRAHLEININEVSGAGAAGGAAGGLSAFLKAEIKSGFDVVSQILKFDEEVKKADLIITGEGKIDSQTLNGKLPIKISKLAKCYDKKTLAIGGIIDLDSKVFDGIISIQNKPMSLETSLNNSYKLLTSSSKRAANLINVGKTL